MPPKGKGPKQIAAAKALADKAATDKAAAASNGKSPLKLHVFKHRSKDKRDAMIVMQACKFFTGQKTPYVTMDFHHTQHDFFLPNHWVKLGFDLSSPKMFVPLDKDSDEFECIRERLHNDMPTAEIKSIMINVDPLQLQKYLMM